MGICLWTLLTPRYNVRRQLNAFSRAAGDVARAYAVQLLMDVDEAVRDTFALAEEDGTRLRRAFFGVASGAVELAGLNPYTRLTDGLTAMCR